MSKKARPTLKELKAEREAQRREALELGCSEAEWHKLVAEADLEIDQELLEEAKDTIRRNPDALYSRSVQSAIYSRACTHKRGIGCMSALGGEPGARNKTVRSGFPVPTCRWSY